MNEKAIKDDVIIRMTELADEDTEPLKAFTVCTKEGLTGLKRDEFNQLYEMFIKSPFDRVLHRRMAKESRFFNLLLEKLTLVRPKEEEVLGMSKAIAAVRQNPAAFVGCIELFKGYLAHEDLMTLQEAYDYLWPA